jgi:hypothetical protein
LTMTMIEKQIVDGRPALVAYMDDKFNPVHARCHLTHTAKRETHDTAIFAEGQAPVKRPIGRRDRDQARRDRRALCQAEGAEGLQPFATARDRAVLDTGRARGHGLPGRQHRPGGSITRCCSTWRA